MRISFIVAAAENGVIGNAGEMPWRLSTDLKRFRALTLGKPVIMGRKTFQSLPKVLDGRDNIVVTRDPNFHAVGVEIAPSMEAALAIAREKARTCGADEIMVIGGGEIYRAAWSIADRVYLTRVHATIAGDTTFPVLQPSEWRKVSEETLPRGPKDDHEASLLVFERAT